MFSEIGNFIELRHENRFDLKFFVVVNHNFIVLMESEVRFASADVVGADLIQFNFT